MGEFRKQKCLQVMLIAIIIPTYADKFQANKKPTNRPDYELASCKSQKVPQGYRTFCEHISELFLPPDLSPRTQILVIENSLIENFDKGSAKRYPNVVDFSYVGFTYGKSRIKTAIKMSEDFFLGFPLLEKISIANVIIPYIVKEFMNLPKMVKSVTFTNADLKDGMLKLIDLPDLFELNLETNHLTRIPEVHRKSSIIRFNLRNNPITEITGKNVAVHCQLREFYVSSSPDLEKFLNKNCECNRLIYYFKTKSIIVDWWPVCADESCKTKEPIPVDISYQLEKCKKIALNMSVDDEPFENESKNNTEVASPKSNVFIIKYLFWLCIMAILVVTAAFSIYVAWTGRKKYKREPKSVEAFDDEFDLEGEIEEENEE